MDCDDISNFHSHHFCSRHVRLSSLSLNDDLAKSDLCKYSPDDLNELVVSYKKTLTAALDKHAPAKTRTIVVRLRVPWYTDEIR